MSKKSPTKIAKRKVVVGKFQRNVKDVGSPEVQIALLTDSLEILTGYLRANPNDRSAERGMLAKVSRRKKLLGYLKETNLTSYQKVISALNLRK